MECLTNWERKRWKGKQISQANTDNDSPFPTSQAWLQKNKKKKNSNILSDNKGKATSLSLLLTNVHLIIREPDIINIYTHQRDVGICKRLSARSECRFSWLRQWERDNGSFFSVGGRGFPHLKSVESGK